MDSVRKGVLNPLSIAAKESQKRKIRLRHTCVQTVVVTLVVLVIITTSKKVERATKFSQVGC